MASQNSGFISDAAENPASATCMQRMRPMLGTFCSIQAAGDGIDLDGAINEAFGAVNRVNELMHPTHGIDMARINQCLSQLIQIDAWTWRVLQLAQHIYKASDGIFDPCLPSKVGCMRDVELLPDNQLICHVPVLLDLGGIAKGFAIDCAIDVLQQAGCSSASVNVGGDMRVIGDHHAVHINYAEQMIPLTLNQQALAVSAVDNNSRPVEHRGYYSRIEACTIHHKFAAVIAERAALADALTKYVLWSDIDASAYLCQQFNAQLVIAG